MANDRWCRLSGRCGWKRRISQWAPRASFRLSVRVLDKVLVLWYGPRRGYYLAEIRDVGGRLLDSIARPPGWGRKMKRRQVGSAPSTSDVQHIATIESDLLGELQPLVNHCCITRYDDGTVRTPGTWMLKTVGSAWVMVVKDPDACAQLQVIGQSADEVLRLASKLLESDDAPWEVDPWAKQRTKKKAS